MKEGREHYSPASSFIFFSVPFGISCDWCLGTVNFFPVIWLNQIS